MQRTWLKRSCYLRYEHTATVAGDAGSNECTPRGIGIVKVKQQQQLATPLLLPPAKVSTREGKAGGA